MYTPEKIAALSDIELKSLAANVTRLGVSGTAVQVMEAARIGPMIEEEKAARAAGKAALVKTAAVKKSAVKKAAAKKKPAKAKVKADADADAA